MDGYIGKDCNNINVCVRFQRVIFNNFIQNVYRIVYVITHPKGCIKL